MNLAAMRPAIILLATVLTLALALAAPAAALTLRSTGTARIAPWGSFDREPASGRGRVGTSVELAQVVRGRGEAFWVAEMTARTGRREGRQWADGRACPGLRAVMASAGRLEPMTVEAAAGPPAPAAAPAAEGLVYVLEAPARFRSGGRGDVRLRAGEGSALGRWVEGALAELAPCWRTEPPDLDRRP